MLERMAGLPAGIDGLRAVGKLTSEDYEEVVEPLLDAARAQGRRVRLLVEIGPQYRGFTPGLVWAKRGAPRLLKLIEGYALVTDIHWIRTWARIAGFTLPWPLHVFRTAERDRAVEWLAALPEGPAVSHRIIPDTGVLLVEVTEPLRAQDFEALARTTDTWLATHDQLRGLVIHTRHFPGWENVAGLQRHLGFVRGHQRRIARVALVADSRLVAVLPRVVDRLVHPEVKGFGYDELDAAVAWAGAGALPSGPVDPAFGPPR